MLLSGFCCNGKSRETSLGTVSLLCPGGAVIPSTPSTVSRQGHWWPGLGKADVYPSPDLWAAVGFMDHLLLPKTASGSLLWVSSVSLAPLPPPVLGPPLLSGRYLLACLRLLLGNSSLTQTNRAFSHPTASLFHPKISSLH